MKCKSCFDDCLDLPSFTQIQCNKHRIPYDNYYFDDYDHGYMSNWENHIFQNMGYVILDGNY